VKRAAPGDLPTLVSALWPHILISLQKKIPTKDTLMSRIKNMKLYFDIYEPFQSFAEYLFDNRVRLRDIELVTNLQMVTLKNTTQAVKTRTRFPEDIQLSNSR
jgi:hypothetical protein